MTAIDGTAGDGRQHDWCQASVLRQRTRCSVDITVPKGGKEGKKAGNGGGDRLHQAGLLIWRLQNKTQIQPCLFIVSALLSCSGAMF